MEPGAQRRDSTLHQHPSFERGKEMNESSNLSSKCVSMKRINMKPSNLRDYSEIHVAVISCAETPNKKI